MDFRDGTGLADQVDNFDLKFKARISILCKGGVSDWLQHFQNDYISQNVIV
jgi:hypothetical protein